MRRLALALAAVLSFVGLVALPPSAIAAPACPAVWTIGAGGVNDNDSMVFAGAVDQRVGYPTGVSNDSVEAGYREMDRLIQNFRAVCPGSHVSVAGYSEGAAVAHIWVSRHPGFPNANYVLFSDPKRAPGPGSGGFAGPLGGLVGGATAGDDANLPLPGVTICYSNDGICNYQAGPIGYLFQGAHQHYDWKPRNYLNARGVIFY